ncbi:MerR family transcriptional regulator [Catenulispora rubra]|uniref:MerR family transcriptional regulator n=1 Tax=Catenulispora rubra TaxID=280293 RepID=UPI0018924FC8|nr:MerR family transcriptional regulator [Catenulispora rubra]
MDDDGPGLLTIGQLAARTGVPVSAIRYWSDIGALSPAGRSAGGYRLYAAAAVARLDLIATLRELGLPLADVRRVLHQETTVAAVAAVHVRALDAQLRTLRLRRAVLATVVKRKSPPEETALMNKLARLSAAERQRIIEDFVDEVFGGTDVDPWLYDRMSRVSPDLPDDPSPEQVDAWVELADLVRDPDFRVTMRELARSNAEGRTDRERGQKPNVYQWFAKKITWQVGEARERGVAPNDPEAAHILTRLLGDDPARRVNVLTRLERGTDLRAERYRQLLAAINGQPADRSLAPDFAWLIAALRAHYLPPAAPETRAA